MKIIGLTGFAKSGKSTAAAILKNMGGQEVAFAKHLKDVCSIVFGIRRSHFDDQAHKEVEFGTQEFFAGQTFFMPAHIRVTADHVAAILDFFEIPKRLQPDHILRHIGVYLKSPRHVAQYVGTEILRSVSSNIHIDMAFKLNEGSTAKFLVCSDVRFDNELKAVQGNGGLMIGISRKKAEPADLVNIHPSEKEIPTLISQSDVIATNESTIEEFQAFVHGKVFDYLNKK